MNRIVKSYGVVYLIRNLVNGKVYVGQTTRSITKRFRNHVSHSISYTSGKYKGKDTPLFRAIHKYGKESFSISCLCSCQSKEELDLMEDLYILTSGGIQKDSGYNIRRGGANGEMSPEVRKSCGYGKIGFKHTEESKRKMSEAIKKYCKDHPRPPMTDATKNKISDGQKNRKPISVSTRERLKYRFSGEKGTAFKPEADTQLIMYLYSKNYSSLDISKVVPLTSDGVLHRLKKCGVTMRLPWAKVKPEIPIEHFISPKESG